jgi:hypothetical protein
VRPVDVRRFVLISGAALVLSACGASPPPITAPIAMSQSPANATRGGSWMSQTQDEDLLYVSDAGSGNVYIFTYPGRKYVGTLQELLADPEGVCSDTSGDVFVTEFGLGGDNYVQEYAHGALTPIATLDAPGEPLECSVDRTTGNLAVAIYTYSSSPTGVAIYAGAQGSPTEYSDSSFRELTACSYDDKGDLFVGGDNPQGAFALAELRPGDESLSNIELKSSIDGGFLWPMLWNNGHLTLGFDTSKYSQQYSIDDIAVSAMAAKVTGGTQLYLKNGYFSQDSTFYILQGRIIVTAVSKVRTDGRAILWKYPSGGDALDDTQKFGSEYLDGVTISRARGLGNNDR